MARPGGHPSHGADAAPGPGNSTASGSARARRARLDSLTALRFFAALVVLGFHFDYLFYFRSASLRAAPRVMVQGTVGVSFFFILSGFVLTWSHRAEDPAPSFLRRRLARIGPLHVATWALMIPIVLVIGWWPGFGNAFVSLALVAPWSPGWSAHLALNIPSWSLGCELFFYLLFPLLIAVLARAHPTLRRTVAVGCVVVVVIAAFAVNAGGGDTEVTRWFLYYFPPTRLLEFVLGMVLAIEVAEARLPRIGLIPATVLAAAAYVAVGRLSEPFRHVAVTIVPFALLIVASAQADATGRPSLYRFRPLVTLGVWSYALYLCHFPVLALIGKAINKSLNRPETVLLGLGFVAVSVAVSGLLHALVERPLEVRLRGVPPRPEAEAHSTSVH